MLRSISVPMLIRMLLCVGATFLGVQPAFPIFMEITRINGVDVPPGEVHVPTGTQTMTVDWIDTSPDGVRRVGPYVDGQGMACLNKSECVDDNRPQSGSFTFSLVGLADGRHELQVEGSITNRVDLSSPVGFWIGTYKDTTGQEECDQPTIGGPIDVTTGEMYYRKIDMIVKGPIPIEFERRYKSQSGSDGPLGYGWRHTYQMTLEDDGAGRKKFVDEEGRPVYFSLNQVDGEDPTWGYNYIERMDLDYDSVEQKFVVTDRQLKEYWFTPTGQLEKIRDRNGNELNFLYKTYLETISDGFGRSVELDYDMNGRLETIQAGGRTITYEYTDGQGNLNKVIHPDSSFETYDYNDPNDIHNLTDVKDTDGDLIEGHTYDTSDRVTNTRSEGDNYKYTLSYDSSTQTTVTRDSDPTIQTVYTHDPFSGLVTSSSGPGCMGCGPGGTSAQIQYNRYLKPTLITDAVGVMTQLSYEPFGGVLQERIEAFGSTQQRSLQYTWEPAGGFNFIDTITMPTVGTPAPSGNCVNTDKVVDYTYDGQMNVTAEATTGCAGDAGFSRSIGFTYDSDYGMVEAIDGPREPVSDVTMYQYYSPTDPDVNLRGRLEKITNAKGHETRFEDYDFFGNAGKVTDANGVETAYLYDAKDRVRETRIRIDPQDPMKDIVTEYVYDPNGNLDLVREPNCVAAGPSCPFSVDYVYDEVNRLKEVLDPFGNKIARSYDDEGNRIREEYRDSQSVVHRFTNFAYDAFNRLEYVYHTDPPTPEPPDPAAVFYRYTYYADGLRETDTDPEGHVTTFVYDDLKRLESVTQTVNGSDIVTEYEYDLHGNLAKVTDPRDLETTYTNHDMGWRLTVGSPDTGLTAYEYDLAGNLKKTTDARGIEVDRAYDELNRLTTVSYPNSDLDVVYSYDSPLVAFGVGRRTGMSDHSGSTVYEYEARGLLSQEQKTFAGGGVWSWEYDYDKSDNLTQVLYPTEDPMERQGKVDYSYDLLNRVSGITAEVNGVATVVATALSYEPFGPRTGMTFGNGLSDSRTYGGRYELEDWSVGNVLSYTHSYDKNLNLTSREDNLVPTNDRLFDYDEIGRLTFASGPWGSGTGCPGNMTYAYDDNGNRTCKGETPTATTYSYVANTNQFDASAGAEVGSYSHDLNGNVTAAGEHSYGFSNANRLESVDGGDTATYVYDGDGRRVVKETPKTTTYFFYDPTGRLLSEVTDDPRMGKEYVFLEDDPVARVDWSTEQPLGGCPGRC